MEQGCRSQNITQKNNVENTLKEENDDGIEFNNANLEVQEQETVSTPDATNEDQTQVAEVVAAPLEIEPSLEPVTPPKSKQSPQPVSPLENSPILADANASSPKSLLVRLVKNLFISPSKTDVESLEAVDIESLETFGGGGLEAFCGGSLEAFCVGSLDTTGGGSLDTTGGGSLDTTGGGSLETTGGGSLETTHGVSLETTGGVSLETTGGVSLETTGGGSLSSALDEIRLFALPKEYNRYVFTTQTYPDIVAKYKDLVLKHTEEVISYKSLENEIEQYMQTVKKFFIALCTRGEATLEFKRCYYKFSKKTRIMHADLSFFVKCVVDDMKACKDNMEMLEAISSFFRFSSMLADVTEETQIHLDELEFLFIHFEYYLNKCKKFCDTYNRVVSETQAMCTKMYQAKILRI